jgi:uncharacterized protein YaaN involved in tellurite resistance
LFRYTTSMRVTDDAVNSINLKIAHQKQRLGKDLTFRNQLKKANTIKKLTENRLYSPAIPIIPMVFSMKYPIG